LIGIGAAIALFRFKLGVIPVVLGAAVAGLAIRMVQPLIG
jgi:chromate transporter